jgi:CO/xanthine dehydrogenase FAD-binding subunit
MAVALHLEADGKTCASAKVVVGAVSEGPLQASDAARTLVGQVLDVQRISKAADDASAAINPLPPPGLTRSNLKENIRVHLRRTFTAAFDRACGQSV